MMERVNSIQVSKPPKSHEFLHLNKHFDIIIETSESFDEASYLLQWLMWVRRLEFKGPKGGEWMWLFPAAPHQWIPYLWISGKGVKRLQPKTRIMLAPFRHIGVVLQRENQLEKNPILNCLTDGSMMGAITITGER